MRGKAQLWSRNTTTEKKSLSGKLSDKGKDISLWDSSHRFIVRLPNRSQISTRSVNCGSKEDKKIPRTQGPSLGKK